MEKIYEQTNDLHVRNIIFYGNTDDHYVYLDEAFTKKATSAQVKDAFLKRQLMLYVNGDYAIPYFFGANGVVTVTIVDDPVSFDV